MNVGLVGVPGCGKSTVALYRALEFRRVTPCYILAHDPEHALPRRLPDGRSTELVRHDTTAAAARALAKGQPGVHAVACLDAVEVVELGQRLGQASLARARGGAAPPVIVLVDEVTNCREMKPRELGETLQAALTLRRHRHCGLIWTTQSPRLVHYHFLSKATELYVFQLRGERDINRLVEEANFPEEQTSKIRNLKPHEFLRLTPSTPMVGGPPGR